VASSDPLPSWTVETEATPAEAAPDDAPFRAPGKVDERATLALTQSAWKRPGGVSVGDAVLAGGGGGAFIGWMFSPPLAVLGAIVGALLGLASRRQPRLIVRATPEGIEIVSGRKVRHRVARRQLRELTITGAARGWLSLEAVDRDGGRRPLVVSKNRDELVAIAEKVAAHLGLRRS
jgi:hypothetical protein